MRAALLPLLVVLAGTARADEPPASGPAALPGIPPTTPSWALDGDPGPLDFVGFFFTRATVNNIYNGSQALQGATVGRLFGDNLTTTGPTAAYIEQRAIGFFDYRPEVASGRAALRTGFEVDFTFGDAANAADPNIGGGFNGDTVNIQTKRLAAEVELGAGLLLSVGLQPIADTARNPMRAAPDDLVHGGTKLAFWGTDAAGVNLFGSWGRRHHARVGVYTLFERESGVYDIDDEQAVGAGDILLLMADAELGVAPRLKVGGHLWYLRDAAGVLRSAGLGPGSVPARLNGATPLSLGGPWKGDVVWLGADVTWNRWLAGGPFSAHGFFVANIGTFQPEAPTEDGPTFDDTPAELLGFMFDGEIGWRWGRTDGDRLQLEVLYATGDDTPGDRTLSNVVTGNNFGLPGALHASHGAMLLFPDYRVVNRQVAVVYDPGNEGFGVMAGFASFAVDLLPNALNLRLGTALAGAAAAAPENDGRFIGVEGNAELMYRPMPFLWFGAHGAVVRLGKFLEQRIYRGGDFPQPDGRPWTAFATMTWVPF